MAIVELRFTALPEHVRTARLVAAAVARRAGVAESVLDEVRLAVGEACLRAVGLTQQTGSDEPVTVMLDDGDGRFSIEVRDAVPQQAEGATGDLLGSGNGAAADIGESDLGLAVILGLVDELDVRAGADGGRIRMSWPSEKGKPGDQTAAP
ncbi:MAG: ATP-binding protein [Streptomycetaceae bacterium]|jgi:anti-sigma regulatory factor (Ser/Thr protein kinase)|uniref:ATP-binding protein n=1 Tax=Yinghuangia aomiensis TaxID=676205 RepID=A0ABP9HTE1_9ACTN|nr:ATP-binding protein [Streptomycetaceae bacterium]NUS57189.1 ATP-binding protein [Streptomycetaceae bacterium]